MSGQGRRVVLFSGEVAGQQGEVVLLYANPEDPLPRMRVEVAGQLLNPTTAWTPWLREAILAQEQATSEDTESAEYWKAEAKRWQARAKSWRTCARAMSAQRIPGESDEQHANRSLLLDHLIDLENDVVEWVSGHEERIQALEGRRNA